MVVSLQGRVYFERERRASGVTTPDDRKKKIEPLSALQPDALAALLNSGGPTLLAGLVLGGLAAINRLMMLKPF